MTISLENLDVYIWEDGSDIAIRAQQCLASTDIAVIRIDPATSLPPAQTPGRLAVAVVSVSVIGNAGALAQDWLRAQAIPVIWVATENRGLDPRFYPPAHTHTLPPAFTCAELRAMVLKAARLHDPAAGAVGAPPPGGQLVADCSAMRQLMHEVAIYASCDASAIIHGETGTGKERIAQRLHELSPRAGGPFVAVNCGAVPEGLFEAHFFGHAKGAFTGAVGAHKGYFEQADGGTLFLDEIGDLPPHQQVKLLRVLEQKTITRLGSTLSIPVDFRLVSASHYSLVTLVREGRFRSDLYYRLAVVELEVPNLESRGPLEKKKLFQILIAGTLADGARFAPDWLLDRIALTYFPGNIRELANLSERIGIHVRQTGDWDRAALERILNQFTPLLEAPEAEPAGNPASQAERHRILSALNGNGWRRQDTADALGISRKALWEKMRKLDIQSRSDT